MPDATQAPKRVIDRTKRTVAFPEGGDGVLLRFRFSDLKKVEAEFGNEYIGESDARFGRFETKWIETLVIHGAKQSDGKAAAKVDLDELGLSTKNLVLALKDALYLANMDMTFDEAKAFFDKQMAEIRRKMEAGEDAEEPADPLTPEPSLNGSTAEVSEQV